MPHLNWEYFRYRESGSVLNARSKCLFESQFAIELILGTMDDVFEGAMEVGVYNYLLESTLTTT